MVADYNKNANNKACHITVNSTTERSTYFKCYNSIFEETTALNITDVINATKNGIFGAVLADFNNSKSTLGIGTVEGIYYEDAGTFIKVFDSGFSYDAARTGKLITVFGTLDANPALIYTDDTFGFIIKSTSTGVVCGDGECSGLENSLTCPADCSINSSGVVNNTGDGCNVNSDCESGKCEAGFCALKTEGERCTTDNQCYSGECNNNKCTNEGFWTKIKNMIDLLVGKDAVSQFFIAWIIVFVVGVATFIGTKSLPIAGMGAFFTLIFTVFIGMISSWFILITILILVIIAAGLFFGTRIGGA